MYSNNYKTYKKKKIIIIGPSTSILKKDKKVSIRKFERNSKRNNEQEINPHYLRS